jgi:Fe-S-cluster containining protein
MYSKLLHLFDIIDQSVAQICAQFPAEVLCKPGCADCCNAAFDISFIEAGHLASLLLQDKQLVQQMQPQAEAALQAYETLLREGLNPGETRIRCPMLGEDETCLCYAGRPVNCRTYGTPTVIHNKGHVCGFSNFKKGLDYPTINLSPIQDNLHQWSVEYAGKEHGTRRFPIALVILRPSRFAPEGEA